MIKRSYVVSRFLKLFLTVSLCFVGLFIFIQLLEDMSDILRHGGSLEILYYIYSIPAVFTEIAPIITFLSGMFLVGEMMKYGEIKILEISGIKPYSILYTLFFCGLMIYGFTFYVKNYTVPECDRRLSPESAAEKIAFSSPRYLFYGQSYKPPNSFGEVQISISGPPDKRHPISMITGREASYRGEGIWEISEGRIWIIGQNNEMVESSEFRSMQIHSKLTPEILVASQRLNEMNLGELLRIIGEMNELEIFSAETSSHLQERFAYPLLNFFLLLIAIPFFSLKNRLSRFFIISASVLVSFFCYTLYSLGVGIARSGRIHAFWGVWMVHCLIAISLIIYALFRLQKNGKSFII